MLPESKEAWLRWTVQTGMAVITNVVLVSFWLSNVVSDLRAKAGEHDRTIARVEADLRVQTQINIDQAVQQGKSSTEIAALQSGIRDANEKLDRLLQQERR